MTVVTQSASSFQVIKRRGNITKGRCMTTAATITECPKFFTGIIYIVHFEFFTICLYAVRVDIETIYADQRELNLCAHSNNPLNHTQTLARDGNRYFFKLRFKVCTCSLTACDGIFTRSRSSELHWD